LNHAKKSSRGDQIDNAKTFQKQGFAEVILEDDLTEDSLLTTINTMYNNRANYIKKMDSWNSEHSLSKLFDLITK
jgi:UDP-N-acetylglucosamine--N-acetylmuramyl-(pentapeptide) pyrophosphoryl-undecaprenol N-acetylglucosamine transferase